jgi:glutaminyl-peptide cyclotransferase
MEESLNPVQEQAPPRRISWSSLKTHEKVGGSLFVLLLVVTLALVCSFPCVTWTVPRPPAATPPPVPRGGYACPVIPAKLDKQDIIRTVDPLLITRVPNTTGSVTARNYIETYLRGYGWTVEEDSFEDSTPFGQKNFVNIIATLNPAASRRIILSAHYDSKFYTDFTFIGAIDSAAPCGMMLYIASKLANTPAVNNSDVTIQLVFFDGEEAFVSWTPTDSLYGSRHLAALWDSQNQLSNIELLVLLDLIGSSDTLLVAMSQSSNSYFQRLLATQNALRLNGLLSSSKTYFSPRTDYLGYDNRMIQDDHIPFLERGVTVLHLISNPFPSVWHTANDNAGALSTDTIGDITSILLPTVAQFVCPTAKRSARSKRS